MRQPRYKLKEWRWSTCIIKLDSSLESLRSGCHCSAIVLYAFFNMVISTSKGNRFSVSTRCPLGTTTAPLPSAGKPRISQQDFVGAAGAAGAVPLTVGWEAITSSTLQTYKNIERRKRKYMGVHRVYSWRKPLTCSKYLEWGRFWCW